MALSERARLEVAGALARLIERAAREVPEQGPFEPLVEHFTVEDPSYPVRVATLRIGPGQGEGERRRFLDVRIATATGGSDSSTWLHFAPKAELLGLLSAEATGATSVVAAVESGIESLRRFELE